jgi:hypothetical protein
MSWSTTHKKSIDCNNPKGFSQKAHCAGRKARQRGEETKSKSVSEMNKSELKQIIKEEIKRIRLEERVQLFLEKNCPTDASKWSYWKGQAKKKFDVYPSAYANGWAAKMYKDAGGGWKDCE